MGGGFRDTPGRGSPAVDAGHPGAWGYVRGGMGRLSFILADIASDAGATILTGVPAAAVTPGEGVTDHAGRAA